MGAALREQGSMTPPLHDLDCLTEELNRIELILATKRPRGGIGIRGRLRACVRKDVEVHVLSSAFVSVCGDRPVRHVGSLDRGTAGGGQATWHKFERNERAPA